MDANGLKWVSIDQDTEHHDSPSPVPPIHADWWRQHVAYTRFHRQGIDIFCAKAERADARAHVVVIPGWSETFLAYAELIKVLFDLGFNVFTYDHQSQGLSGRWVADSQATWVHSFDDYVDDFQWFVSHTTIHSQIPTFVVAHSMGGLVVSTAMSRMPTLISRAVLLAPMFRNKSATRALKFRFPLPQPLAYWLTRFASFLGMGKMHAIGFFREKSTDPLDLYVTTSCQEQLKIIENIRRSYPHVISGCPTNDWNNCSIFAQKALELRYQLVKTNTLVIASQHDRFVYNRAMVVFAGQAQAAKMMLAPNAYHELLHESEETRKAVHTVICNFFTQSSNDVGEVQPCVPLQPVDPSVRHLTSLPDVIFRAAGLVVASIGIVFGLNMVFGDVIKFDRVVAKK